MTGYSRVLVAFLVALIGSDLIGCGGSSGPSDTTIALDVDPVTTPTNVNTQAITGTTDDDATVTITSATDTVSGNAGANGRFSITVDLIENTMNDFDIVAVDRAGNTRTDAVAILHDNIRPTATFTAPAMSSVTSGQSGFPVTVSYTDDSSGTDPATFAITSSTTIGGMYQQDGTFTTIFTAGSDLVLLFNSATGSGANWTVPDTALFPAGRTELTATLRDLAGNLAAPSTVIFDVGPDPDKLIVVNGTGAAGAEVAIEVGLANALTVSGVQFDFMFDTNVIATVDSVTVGARASTFDATPFNQIAAGQVRVLLFDNGGDVILGGQGPILNVWVTIDAGAAAGPSTLTLEGIVVSDPTGDSSLPADASGMFTVQ